MFEAGVPRGLGKVARVGGEYREEKASARVVFLADFLDVDERAAFHVDVEIRPYGGFIRQRRQRAPVSVSVEEDSRAPRFAAAVGLQPPRFDVAYRDVGQV